MPEFLGKFNKSALIFIQVHFEIKFMHTGNKAKQRKQKKNT